MACLGTTITATGNRTTVNSITYHRTLCSINNTPRGSFSLLPLRQPSTSSTRLCKNSHSSRGRIFSITRAEAKTVTIIEKSGIKIIKNPPESRLADLGVRSWPKHEKKAHRVACALTIVTGWGCDPSEFPWTYSSKETCFLLKGKVKVYPDGSDEAVEIGAGDLVEFPKGMSCTWDVSETVDKHYKFD